MHSCNTSTAPTIPCYPFVPPGTIGRGNLPAIYSTHNIGYASVADAGSASLAAQTLRDNDSFQLSPKLKQAAFQVDYRIEFTSASTAEDYINSAWLVNVGSNLNGEVTAEIPVSVYYGDLSLADNALTLLNTWVWSLERWTGVAKAVMLAPSQDPIIKQKYRTVPLKHTFNAVNPIGTRIVIDAPANYDVWGAQYTTVRSEFARIDAALNS